MIRFMRAARAMTCVAVLFSTTASQALSLPKLPIFARGDDPAAARPLPPGQWPQAQSDLPADPETRFGALENGMRYAIRRQVTPPNQAALRLWIGAGSLQETDAQQGLAHFLEHMAFNGSKSVPEGEMIKILERLGLAFGADTNASTGFEQTSYRLDLPRTDGETIDTSLMLLRETAGNLTIDQAAVDRERGVVLSEERARDTPAYRVYKKRLEFLLKGQRLPTRYPIGLVEVLQGAPASQIAAYYNQYYRPENAVLIAVGDFDPTEMEAKIKARFGDWRGVGGVGLRPDLGKVAERGAEARLVVEPGAPVSIQVAWLRPPDLSADTVAQRRRELIQQLGLAVLNRRLSGIARGETPPFLGAVAFRSDQARSADVTMLSISAEPEGWKAALAAAEAEQRRAQKFGVRQDELDREIEEVRARARSAVAGAATRRPQDLAGEILDSLSDNSVVTGPSDDLALFEAAVKDLKADTVTRALRAAFEGSGPLVFMASPNPIAGGEAALLETFNAARKSEVAPPEAPRQAVWPYETFGDAGKVVETRDVADLDTVMTRFANGVRLTLKPTRFRDDEVLVRVNIGNGLQALPKDRQNFSWASSALIEGGLKQITSEDTERVLASKVYGATFTVTDDAFVLSGRTRPDDLETQLQVLTAYVAEPGWRPEAFQRIKAASKTVHDQYESTAGGVLSRDLAGLLHMGDRRWTFPSRGDMADADFAQLQAQIAPHLANAPLEVVIVGDITVEEATDIVARTFGSLPARAAETPVSSDQLRVGFPPGVDKPLVLKHKGRGDQALAYIAWPTDDFWADPQRARDTAILGQVMNLRLIADLREAQGVTYSPSVNYSHSLVWDGWGYLAASVQVPPAKLDDFFRDVERIAADLKSTPVSDDELERARKPRLDAIQKSQLTNPYWLHELSGAQADPRKLDSIRQVLPGTERVSAAAVQRAAQAFLDGARAYRIEVRPGP